MKTSPLLSTAIPSGLLSLLPITVVWAEPLPGTSTTRLLAVSEMYRFPQNCPRSVVVVVGMVVVVDAVVVVVGATVVVGAAVVVVDDEVVA